MNETNFKSPIKKGQGFKSVSKGWAALWGVWSALTLVFVCVRVLPAFARFMELVDRHPEMMLDWRGVLGLGTLLAWFVLGLLALLFLQLSVRRLRSAD